METTMAAFHPPIELNYSAKSFSFDLGAQFRGLTITPADGGFNIILRACLTNGTRVYSMTVDNDVAEGLANLVEALSGSGGAKLWHYDKYANAAVRKQP